MQALNKWKDENNISITKEETYLMETEAGRAQEWRQEQEEVRDHLENNMEALHLLKPESQSKWFIGGEEII